MNENDGGDTLKWEDLVYLADMFAQGGCKEMRFLGGEPTLHPAFSDFVAYSLQRGFSVTVFTSGIMSDKVKAGLRRVYKTFPGADKDLSFLCNLNDPEVSPPEETKKVEEFLGEFGASVMPGFNIYRKDFSLDFLFRYIENYKLRRSIRLGITHPIFKENNSYISIPGMKEVTERIMGYVPRLIKEDVAPSLDCGFPLCHFDDAQLGLLYKASRGTGKFTCGSPVDIGPDMMAWACFPLSGIRRRSVYEFDSYREMMDYYRDLGRDIRKESAGIYEKCAACDWLKRGLCGGGCTAHILKEMDNSNRLGALNL